MCVEVVCNDGQQTTAANAIDGCKFVAQAIPRTGAAMPSSPYGLVCVWEMGMAARACE